MNKPKQLNFTSNDGSIDFEIDCDKCLIISSNVITNGKYAFSINNEIVFLEPSKEQIQRLVSFLTINYLS